MSSASKWNLPTNGADASQVALRIRPEKLVGYAQVRALNASAFATEAEADL